MRSGLHRLAFGLTPALLFLLGNTVSAAESAENLVEKGRVYEGKFQAKEALPLYQAAEKLEPRNPHILVLIARQYRYLMTDAAAKEEKLRLGHLALDYWQCCNFGGLT
jgi:hypothetical protein